MIDNYNLGYYEKYFLPQVSYALNFTLIDLAVLCLVTYVERSIPSLEYIHATIFDKGTG